jgi:hypothetical protein
MAVTAQEHTDLKLAQINMQLAQLRDQLDQGPESPQGRRVTTASGIRPTQNGLSQATTHLTRRTRSDHLGRSQTRHCAEPGNLSTANSGTAALSIGTESTICALPASRADNEAGG